MGTPEPEMEVPVSKEHITPSTDQQPPLIGDSVASSFEPDEPLDLISEGVSNLELDHLQPTELEISKVPKTEEVPFLEALTPSHDDLFTHPDDIIPDLIYPDDPKETKQDIQKPLSRQSPQSLPMLNDLLEPIPESGEGIDLPQGDPMSDSLNESMDLSLSETVDIPNGKSNNLKSAETPP